MFTWEKSNENKQRDKSTSPKLWPSRLQCSKLSTTTKTPQMEWKKMLQKIVVNNLQRIVSFEMHLVVSQWKNAKAMFKLLAVIIPLLRWFRKAVWTRWKNQTVSHSFLFTILVCLVGFLFLQFSFYVLYLCLFFLFLSFCKHSTDTRFFHFHYELGNISTITLVVGAYCRLLCAYMRMRYFSRLNQCNAFR